MVRRTLPFLPRIAADVNAVVMVDPHRQTRRGSTDHIGDELLS